MSLAIRNHNGAPMPANYQAEAPVSAAAMSLHDVWEMAGYVAKSNLFGVSTPEQAFSLMMLCQAEGLHPILAMRRYHIVKNRPTMRADAMQAEFQSRGGVIKIMDRTTTLARAMFSHPTHHPEPVEFSFSMEDAKMAGLVGPEGMYKKYPDVMLWARLVTKAIRVIYPGIVAGIYSVEEIEDMAEASSPAAIHATVQREANRAIAAADIPVPGWNPNEPDTRAYHLVVTQAVDETNRACDLAWAGIANTSTKPASLDARKVHGILAVKAVNTDHADGPAPTKVGAAITFATKVYEANRQWLRGELATICREHVEASNESLVAVQAAESPDPDILAAADIDDEPESESREPRQEG